MDRRTVTIAIGAIALVAVILIAWYAFGPGSSGPSPSPTATSSPSATPSSSPTTEPTETEAPSPTASETPEPTQAGGPIQVAWSAAEGIDAGADILGVRFVGGQWIAVGAVLVDARAAAIWTSDDGATWARADIDATPNPDEYTQVLDVAALDDGTLVAVGSWGAVPSDQFSRAVWISTDDGATWTETRQQAGALNAVISGGPGLIAAESSGGGIGPARGWVATSADGLTWERLPMEFEANLLTIGAIGDTVAVAGGVETDIPGEMDAAAWYSEDGGQTWTAVDLLDGGLPEQVLAIAAFDGGLVATGSAGSSWVTSDGIAWEHGAIDAGSSGGGVAVVDGGFVAAGNIVGQDLGEALSWTSVDGLDWDEPVPFGTPNVHMSAAAGSGTTVVAGGTCASTSCDTVLWWGEVNASE